MNLEDLEVYQLSMEIGESPQVDQAQIAEFDGVNISTIHGAKGLEFPVVFIVIWVAGEFGYVLPDTDSEVFLSIEPVSSDINWSPMSEVRVKEGGWVVTWPSQGQSLTMREGQQLLLVLPLERAIPVIHKKRWWNLLMANPLGYLPEDGNTDVVHIELPAAVIIGSGPVWMRGWMFSFFMSFLLSSFGFKLLLRLD